MTGDYAAAIAVLAGIGDPDTSVQAQLASYLEKSGEPEKAWQIAAKIASGAPRCVGSSSLGNGYPQRERRDPADGACCRWAELMIKYSMASRFANTEHFAFGF